MCWMIKSLITVHILFMLFGSIMLLQTEYDLTAADIEKIAKDYSDSNVLSGYLWNTGSDTVDPAAIRDDLNKKFPFILSAAKFPPLQIKAGGLFGQFHLLYASLTEILVIYHFPLHTSGDSGRHFMNISVTVLQGKVSTWSTKMPTVKEYFPSTSYSYKIGERQFVTVEKDSYILVHGRGLVPLSFWYAIADSICSSCDPASALHVASFYARAVYSTLNIQKYLTDAYTHAWTYASNGLPNLPEAFAIVRNALVDISCHLYQQGLQMLGSSSS